MKFAFSILITKSILCTTNYFKNKKYLKKNYCTKNYLKYFSQNNILSMHRNRKIEIILYKVF